MKGAMRTITVKIGKPSGRINKRSQRFLIPAAHNSTKLINSLSKTNVRE